MRCFVVILFGLTLAACGAAQIAAHPTTGSIVGLARDHDSGDPVALADLRLRAQGSFAPLVAHSASNGTYTFDHLEPGQYSLDATFAGQPVFVQNISVRVGNATFVDVVFTLGRPDPIHIDFGNWHDGEIEHYHPPRLGGQLAMIEGTISDTGSRDRVSGAVVTVSGGPNREVEQAVSDDAGRFKFDALAPGTYEVSAYYSISGRAQVEVRRSDVHVAGAEAAIVPLWIEIAKQ